MSLQREGRVKKNICEQEFDGNIIAVFYWKNALDTELEDHVTSETLWAM